MQFEPPRCPNQGCPRHADPGSKFCHRIGFYYRLCRPRRIQRFLCKTCTKSFSSQTFCADYRDRRPDLNVMLFQLLSSGVGLRHAGRLLHLGVNAVQMKFRKVARTAGLMARNLADRLPPGRPVMFDELETHEQKPIWRVSVGVLIDRDSAFILDTTVASIRRSAPRGTRRRRAEEIDELVNGRRVDESRAKIAEAFGRLAELLDGGSALLHTDLKGAYVTAVRRTFADGQIVHVRTPGRAPRTHWNPLFRINLTHKTMRERNGRLHRRSWLHSKRRQQLGPQLDLQATWRNYCWARFNNDKEDETPAVLLGLVPRRLSESEVLAWRQDWGPLSIHPISKDGSRTVRQRVL